MDFTVADVFLILLVVAGATKAAAFFAAAGKSMTASARKAAAVKSVAIQAVVLSFFAWRGQNIMAFFHVSLGALEVAGGIILFIFALGLVLGEEHAHDDSAPVGDIAIYPLAVPLMASPQAIVGTVIIFAKAPDLTAKLWAYGALVGVLIFNLVIMYGLALLLKGGDDTAKKSSGYAGVLLRIVAILLCALAVELIVMGLREYGVLPAVAGAMAH
jgi:multiple antibiotic resistance protein